MNQSQKVKLSVGAAVLSVGAVILLSGNQSGSFQTEVMSFEEYNAYVQYLDRSLKNNPSFANIDADFDKLSFERMIQAEELNSKELEIKKSINNKFNNKN